jgi:hypothetical protein
MMDLALEIGCTRDELGKRIRESEVRDWTRYVRQKGLPMQRLEHLLARILMILDLKHMKAPGTVGYLSDYMPGAKEVKPGERVIRQLEGAFGPGIVVSRKDAIRKAANG